jgi:hypothetical protein
MAGVYTPTLQRQGKGKHGMALTDTDIVGSVDTHKESHTVAALSGTGRLVGTAQFPATPDGYQELLTWLRGVCDIVWCW